MEVRPTEIQRRLEKLRVAAREAGLKLTHQRIEIFREVAGSLDHPDAETVLRGVQARVPTVSLDTVYRTLWLLEGLGLVSTLGPRHESVRFDANLTHHHHWVCIHCGLARDFESAELATLRLPDTVEGFGRVVETNVQVRGVCNECAVTRAEEPTRPCTGTGRKRRKS